MGERFPGLVGREVVLVLLFPINWIFGHRPSFSKPHLISLSGILCEPHTLAGREIPQTVWLPRSTYLAWFNSRVYRLALCLDETTEKCQFLWRATNSSFFWQARKMASALAGESLEFRVFYHEDHSYSTTVPNREPDCSRF